MRAVADESRRRQFGRKSKRRRKISIVTTRARNATRLATHRTSTFHDRACMAISLTVVPRWKRPYKQSRSATESDERSSSSVTGARWDAGGGG